MIQLMPKRTVMAMAKVVEMIAERDEQYYGHDGDDRRRGRDNGRCAGLPEQRPNSSETTL